MNTYKKPYVIAEIGCNHKGDMEIAKELIKVAKIFCKVDAVKFQKRNNKELLTESQYNAPHPNPVNAYGETYGEHREFLEFSLDQHQELKKFCTEMEITYSTSVWDLTSAQEIASLQPEFIKIPSACNNHFEMLTWLCENYSGEIHISTGMTTKTEIRQLVEFFTEKGRNRDLVIYNCTSGYPVPFEDVCLLEITRMKQLYGDKVKHIGFSGHHLGGHDDILAYYSQPGPAIIAVLTLLVGFVHFNNGVRSAIEDYTGGLTRKALLLASTIVSYGAAATGVFAIAKIAL